MQQHRGHAAALSILGFAVLGILAASALIAAQRHGLETVGSPSDLHHTSSGAAPAADFSADDEQAARATRLLQQRADSAGGAVASSEHAKPVFWLAPAPAAALLAPAGRINLSLGPRAPPRALNLKLRRLAWQA